MDGTRLKKQRKLLGLSAEKLAERLGTTRVSVARWESGQHEPDDAKKKQIAEVLNTTVAYLIGETDDPKPRFTALKKETESQGELGILDRVNALLEARGMTQAELAGLMGWSTDELLDLLHSEQVFSLDEWAKLTRILGTTIDNLATREIDSVESIVSSAKAENARSPLTRVEVFADGKRGLIFEFPPDTPLSEVKQIAMEAYDKVHGIESENQSPKRDSPCAEQ